MNLLLDKLKKVDWLVVLILGLFGVIGVMLVYSATIDPTSSIHIPLHRNILNYAIGFVGLFVFALFDFRVLVKGSLYAYLFGVVLLAAVYPFGVTFNEQKGWFKIPLIGYFQPAELMKLVLIIAVAAMMARRRGEPLELVRDVMPIGAAVFVPFFLVLIQPDLGNAIIFIVVLIGLFWIGNIKFSHVLIGTTAIGGMIALTIFLFLHYHDPITQYLGKHGAERWVTRIDTFINPSSATKDEKYQVVQSMTAIGAGSLTGDGFLHGSSVHQGFIPYAYADSIFVVLGEEFGFRGAAVLLLLYFLMIYRLILISIQSSDLAGSYMIVGVVSLFVFQIFENIGMLIGLMPLTGITLPFISYGGTSLLVNMVSVGLALSVRVHQEQPSMFQDA